MNEDETARGAETPGAVERAAEAILEACYGQDLPEAPIDLARAALTAALEDVDAMARVVHREICEGNIVDCREWGGQCVDAVVAVVAHLVGTEVAR